MNAPWAVTPEKIQEAIRTIVSVGRPRRVILFGSAAQGQTTRHSDVDFLVITPHDVLSPRQESVRIRRALRSIVMPMDILVISEQRLRELGHQPGLIYREALRRGKVVYEAAA
jgi:predicted nucleotidyltransferase